MLAQHDIMCKRKHSTLFNKENTHNFFKKSYTQDSTLFWYNISFYFDIFAIVCNAINFRLDKCSLFPFSLGDSTNLIFFIALVICLIGTFIQYSNIKKYIKQTN